MASNKILIEIAYASQDTQKIISLEVDEGTTIDHAILASGILSLFPEIQLEKQKVGVFSQARTLNDVVKEGDRIEIYRALIIDPKEARRKRVKK